MTVVGLVALGLVAGALAASLGVGGGIIIVPALVVLFEFSQHAAQGTSLAVIIPTAIVAVTVHARAQRVEWRPAFWVGAGGILGAVVGSRVALALDGRVLRRMFAVLLVIVAVRLLVANRRGRNPE
jgi:uncharacterized membrane protein YfcA